MAKSKNRVNTNGVGRDRNANNNGNNGDDDNNNVVNDGPSSSNTGPSKNNANTTTSSTTSSTTTSSKSIGRFSIRLTFLFLLLAFVTSTFIAFFIGWIARLVLLSHLGLTPYDPTNANVPNDIHIHVNNNNNNNNSNNNAMVAISRGMSKKRWDDDNDNDYYNDDYYKSGKMKRSIQLPSPKVIEGKNVPFTTYASKTFQMAGVATSNTLHIDRTATVNANTMKSMTLLMEKSRKDFDGGPDIRDQGGEDDEDKEVNNEMGDGWVPVDQVDCNECSRGKGTTSSTTTSTTSSTTSTSSTTTKNHNSDEDGLHLPAGQHLLVDIKNVDPNFLNSEQRLASAMIELIDESKLTLLSYHCHSLVPVGVSCAGVLLESHVAFHTWPMEGVITMDLFTCGGGLLIPTLPSIERLFGIASVSGVDVMDDVNGVVDVGSEESDNLNDNDDDDNDDNDHDDDSDVPRPTLLWSHKLRGFREGFSPNYVRSKNPLDGSLGRYVLGKLDFDLKRPLLSTATSIQSVNIYEVMEPKNRDYNSYLKSQDEESPSLSSYEASSYEASSYEASYPQSFGPDKMLFLDDIVQSTLYGDASYHESIVHPAMLAHAHPKQVAIIGGGEGATLREVLKHKSVTEAVVLEIDRELAEICREYMPEWSDCTDLEGSTSAAVTTSGADDANDRDEGAHAKSCFDDERTRAVYEDAFRWFVDRFGDDEQNEDDGARKEDKFDVVIMDALDPNTSIEIAGGLYDDTTFVDSLFNGLSPDGVFVVQLGKSKMITDPPHEMGRFKDTALMIDALGKAGFVSIHTYDEGHSHFYMPWSYLVAFKDYKSRAAWFRTAPQIQIELRKRLVETRSGKPVLRYFDAATMIGYQLPSKAQETVHCRKEDVWEDEWNECNELIGHHGIHNLRASEYLKVGKSGLGDSAGRGLFATKDIPMDSAIAHEGSSLSFHFPPLTWSVIDKLREWVRKDENYEKLIFVDDEISSVYTYAEGYGYGATFLGEPNMAVESGIMLFMNHGCNGTNNYGQETDLNEMSVDLKSITEVPEEFTFRGNAPYSPVFDRNWRHALNLGGYTLRDIKAGDELFTTYLSLVGNLKNFKEEVMTLRRQCMGEDVGIITQYESESP